MHDIKYQRAQPRRNQQIDQIRSAGYNRGHCRYQQGTKTLYKLHLFFATSKKTFFRKYQLRWTGDTGRLTEFLDITTCQEAKEWVAEKLSGEDYEKIFGTPDEGKLISVSAETLAIIDKYREERNLTYDQAIKKLITK